MPVIDINAFTASVQASRATATTARVYRWGAKAFARWLEANALDPATLTPDHLKAFVDGQSAGNITPRSLRTMLCGVQAFLHWMHAQGFVTMDDKAISAAIPAVSGIPKRLGPKGAEIRAKDFLAETRKLPDPIRPVLALLLMTRIELKHLCAAKWEDLTSALGVTSLRTTKHGAEVAVRLTRPAIGELVAYTQRRPPEKGATYMFPGAVAGTHLSPATASTVLAGMRKKLGLKRLNATKIRHTR